MLFRSDHLGWRTGFLRWLYCAQELSLRAQLRLSVRLPPGHRWDQSHRSGRELGKSSIAVFFHSRHVHHNWRVCHSPPRFHPGRHKKCNDQKHRILSMFEPPSCKLEIGEKPTQSQYMSCFCIRYANLVSLANRRYALFRQVHFDNCFLFAQIISVFDSEPIVCISVLLQRRTDG